ncbi:LamG domain-containing protein [Candidatus Poribacteria bacterium]|nr:LamG domain-containing protein [Candidatus Poribacteria bacterium]
MKNTLFGITLTILLPVLTSNPISAEIVTDGLVSYWTFDKINVVNNTLKDVWGENHATIHGNPNAATGIVGEALKFDGKNDYIDLTTLRDFGEKSGKSTLEIWIKTTNKTDWMTLLNTNEHVCPYWGIQMNGVKNDKGLFLSNGVVSFDHSLSSEDGEVCGFGALADYAPVFDGKWHQIVYTLDFELNEDGGRGHEKIYIDAELRPRSTFNVPANFGFSPFTAPVHLGARKLDDEAHSFFKGYIDEVRLYERPLTANQVIQNYISKTPYNVEPKKKLTTFWGKLKQ